LAVLLLLVAVVLPAIRGPSDSHAFLFTLLMFGIPALVLWLLGHACRHVWGGDASALWERALIERARQSLDFRVCGTVALFGVIGVAWLIYDARHQEALRKQQYEQQLQADERREAQQAEAERQAEAREAAQRQAAIAAQAAAEREAAAERAAVISTTDLSISNVSLDSIYATYDQARGTITNHSGQTLRYLEFEGTIKDCPLEYGADQCRVMGQQSVKLTVDIPPNQARAFIARLGSWNLQDLDPQDQRFSSWRIVMASSCSQGNLKAHQCANKAAAQ
jgi:Flp pilus assembly protein protease CpaA